MLIWLVDFLPPILCLHWLKNRDEFRFVPHGGVSMTPLLIFCFPETCAQLRIVGVWQVI